MSIPYPFSFLNMSSETRNAIPKAFAAAPEASDKSLYSYGVLSIVFFTLAALSALRATI